MSAPAAAMMWAVASAAAFSLSQTAARLLSETLPPLEMAFFRTAAGVVIVLISWRALLGLRKLREPGWFALRCLLGVIAIYTFMDAVTRIPLALVSLILFSRVLMIPILARFMLGEHVARDVWAAAVLGLAGIATSLWPSLTVEPSIGVVSALVAALASAGSQVAVRRLVLVNDAGIVVVINAAVAALLLGLPATTVWVSPPIDDVPVLGGLAISAVIAQYAAARAFAKAPAAHVALMDFLTVPMAAGAGFLMFGEIPNAYVAAGTIPVLGCALYVARADGARRRDTHLRNETDA